MTLYGIFYSCFWRVIRGLSPKTANKMMMKYLEQRGVMFMGSPSFIAHDAFFDCSARASIIIGEDCTVSKEVMILTHDYSIARGIECVMGKPWSSTNTPHFVKNVEIGKNCFIGARSVLLPGAKIGNNCIIGAGSVVRGSIPDNSIAFGNPCVVYKKTDEWAKKCIERQNFFA